MTVFDQFSYSGKHALVVGGATGMGAAAAQAAAAAGAAVTVFDYSPVTYDGVTKSVQVDLRDPAAIDAAIEQLDTSVDALFSAAGVADGPDVMKINFIGHRHLIDQLVATDRVGRGSAICFISSVAGLGWQNELPFLQEFLATADVEAANDWVAKHGDRVNNYPFSKQVINAYVASQAYPLMKKGIRINAICPGPTDTPLARANAELWLSFAEDYRSDTGVEVHTPEQMAAAMLFLNSAAAAGINGINLLVDYGYTMSSTAGSFAAGKPIIDFLTTGMSMA